MSPGVFRDDLESQRAIIAGALSTARELEDAARATVRSPTPRVARWLRRTIGPPPPDADRDALDRKRANLEARVSWLRTLVDAARAGELSLAEPAPPVYFDKARYPDAHRCFRALGSAPDALRAGAVEPALDALWSASDDATECVWDDALAHVAVQWTLQGSTPVLLAFDGRHVLAAVELPPRAGRTTIRPQGLGRSVGERLGLGSDIHTGDVRFDAAFEVGGDIAYSTHVMTARARRELLRAADTHPVRVELDARLGVLAARGAVGPAVVRALTSAATAVRARALSEYR